DLNFDDVGAGAIGGLRWRVIGGVFEAGGLSGRQRNARNALRQARQIAEADRRFVAAARGCLAVVEIDFAFRYVERARRQRYKLLTDCLSGNERRRTGVYRLPARKGADALRDGSSVADRHDDVVEAAAGLFGDDLRQRGAGALA